MAGERRARLPLALAIGLLAACAGTQGPVNPQLEAVAEKQDALSTSDALEALIAAGADTPADREFAYEVVTAREEDGVAYAFARAAITGRWRPLLRFRWASCGIST